MDIDTYLLTPATWSNPLKYPSRNYRIAQQKLSVSPLLLSRHALHLGILRDPGSEVEDRQYQVDLQCINIGTAQWEQLKPDKEGAKGGVSAESERSSQNPALEWNMASRSGGGTSVFYTMLCDYFKTPIIMIFLIIFLFFYVSNRKEKTNMDNRAP